MFSFFQNASFPIGIDIGAHALRILQFKKSADGLALQDAARLDVDAAEGAERIIEGIRQALSDQNFTGKRVTLSLPDSAVHSKSVRLPQMPDADLAQALQWEAKDRFGFDIGENAGQLVWFRAGEVRRGTEVKDELLLFAINGEMLNTYLQMMASLKLQVAAIDITPCAAFRSVRRASPGLGTGTGALLDVGQDGSQFMIMRDGDLVFYKHIDIGGKAVSEAVAQKLGISPMEAAQMRARLALGSSAAEETAPLDQALRDAMRGPLEELGRELDMCMRYYVITFRGGRPESIGLTGRQAACPEIRGVLAAALGLPVEEAQALRGVQDLGDVARPDRSGEWAVAAGLSLYPVDGAQRAEAAA